MKTEHNIRKDAGEQPAARVALLEVMTLSRETDIREDILFRQGRGQFHISSSGHESMAALADLMRPEDWIYCYYRDRALLLARGVPLEEMALGYFAKADSSSAGRQLASHFCSQPHNVMSCATPTGLQCLPAAGTAWGLKQDGSDAVVFCSIGDASTRQGEFFEALSFAIQEKLPLLFIVQDNGYGISTPTERMTPLGLNIFAKHLLHVVDGRDAFDLVSRARPIVEAVRKGAGPAILWVKFDRLTSHTSSDDHSKYRAPKDITAMRARDPLLLARQRLLAEGEAVEFELSTMEARVRAAVKQTYQAAEKAADPDPAQARANVFSTPARVPAAAHRALPGFPGENWTMANAVNHTLKSILRENNRALMFGEDIEDPKGGVFGLTKGLSAAYPGRVTNSPLAEATIAGLAGGLPVTGFLPIFELQFMDFIGPAFNQIVNQIATLRWRTANAYKCPLIIYAPCGGFLGGGGPWHTQTNEAWLAHAPGLKVYMPSNANDAAQLLYAAAHGEDPVMLLLPKYQFQKQVKRETEVHLYPERARIRRRGDHVTLVAWGNCVELAMAAALQLEAEGVAAEVLDLCSLVPCDWQALHASVRKTGRLVVVQEDNRTCSFGQTIIAEMTGSKPTWEQLYAPPQLVSRDDIHVGFSRVLERAALPDVAKVLKAVRATMGRADDE